MPLTLPLENMTQKDKLCAMELLWDNLSREESHLKSPFWHGAVLRETAREVEPGQASFTDWAAAKERICRKIGLSRRIKNYKIVIYAG